MSKNMISATYHSIPEANDVVTRLENIGVTDSQISLITNKETREGMIPPTADRNVAAEATAAGAGAGGLAGTLLGAMATASLITLPGLNLLAIGTVYTTLAGLATGAVTGGLVGALVGVGISPDDAEVYERELQEGAILITVEPIDDKQHEKIKNVIGESEALHLAA